MSAALGLPPGIFLAAALSHALEKYGVGFALPVGSLVAFAVVPALAGIAAAVAPARRASRLDVLTALQYEQGRAHAGAASGSPPRGFRAAPASLFAGCSRQASHRRSWSSCAAWTGSWTGSRSATSPSSSPSRPTCAGSAKACCASSAGD